MPGSLSPDTVLVRSDRLSWRVLEGDALILHPEAGTLHRLNDTGTRMWELLDGRRTLGTIAAQLTAEYQVDEADAVAELVELGAALIDGGLAEDRTLAGAERGGAD